GIMVARGDLGAEVPYEYLPSIQDEIVTKCRDAGKPVIVATHMLESMIEHPIPTRAEVTDVAHAAMERTDATMLSGETANGKHPTVAIDSMDRILRAAETQLSRYPLEDVGIRNESEARAESAVSLSKSSNATAIMVVTRSGQMARLVSKFRPKVPIIPIVPNESIQRKMQLLYGAFPLLISFGEIEDTAHIAISKAKKEGLVSSGDTVVLVSDTRTKGEAVTSIQIRNIE
ncbi:MAG: hypothetical protein KAS32_16875, partial [Candidatus Peribacteraceae bacterium]|nr:hypothetical protein [Candidatus Peribacteraceae bacterium]